MDRLAFFRDKWAFDLIGTSEAPLWVAGVDEAGVSPFFGPMIHVMVVRPISVEPPADLRDSKKLGSQRRLELIRDIYRTYPGIRILVTNAKTIQHAMEAGQSYTTLKYRAVSALLAYAIHWLGYRGTAYVDAITQNVERDAKELSRLIPVSQEGLFNEGGIVLRLSTESEDVWPDVAAASIVASEMRYQLMQVFRRKLGIQTGELYDKQALKFAKENPWHFHVRATWKNVREGSTATTDAREQE